MEANVAGVATAAIYGSVMRSCKSAAELQCELTKPLETMQEL